MNNQRGLDQPDPGYPSNPDNNMRSSSGPPAINDINANFAVRNEESNQSRIRCLMEIDAESAEEGLRSGSASNSEHSNRSLEQNIIPEIITEIREFRRLVTTLLTDIHWELRLISAYILPPAGRRVQASTQVQRIEGADVANSEVANLAQPLRNTTSSSGVHHEQSSSRTSLRHKQYLSYLYLSREIDRLASFSGWPTAHSNVRPVDLAKAGFFYLGEAEKTQCYFCKGKIANWNRGDNVMERHQNRFPNCRFVLGSDNRNFPVPEVPEPPYLLTINYPCQHPKTPGMKREADRLNTFFSRRWPRGETNPTPAEIAEAGFFFTGRGDQVRCWYCNGGRQNWENDLIPWEEHAKWFPTCQFLLNCKGQRFVHHQLSITAYRPLHLIGLQVGVNNPLQTEERSGQDTRPTTSRGGELALLPAVNNRQERHIRQSTFDETMHSPDATLRRQAKRIIANETTTSNELQLSSPTGINIYPQPTASRSAPSEANVLSDEDARRDQYGSTSEGAMALDLNADTGRPTRRLPETSNRGMGRPSVKKDTDKEKKKIAGYCQICKKEPPMARFFPCDHICCCVACSENIQHCPKCQGRIENVIVG